MLLELLSTGAGGSLQDFGRIGWRRYGVPRGGAMDARSMQQANQLLGNPVGAPVFECVQCGVRIRLLRDSWIALTGADVCSELPSGTARLFRAGEILEMNRQSNRRYAYISVPGGFESQRYMASASSDSRNGLGRALVKGSRLNSVHLTPNASVESVARRVLKKGGEGDEVKLHFALLPGPQFDDFDSATRMTFIENAWNVSSQSDRTGYRLHGSVLKAPSMISSEPVLPGSFQITGSGQPIITMHDGPTVGGYPKLAVLSMKDMDHLSQCIPGTPISFSWKD